MASVPPESMYGNGARLRVDGEDRVVHRVDQIAVETRFVRGQLGDPLAGHVRPDELVDLTLEGGLPPGQHPAVDDCLGGGRDDVGLVAGLEHGRVGGVAQRGAEHAGHRPEFGDAAFQVVGVEAQPGLLGDRGQELGDGVGEHQRKLMCAKACHRPRRWS